MGPLRPGGTRSRGEDRFTAKEVVPETRSASIGRIPYLFLADFGKTKSYQIVVKKSPQTGREPGPIDVPWLLTRRENEVLILLRTGASDKEIATALGISRYTASKHVENILKKMKVTNRTAAAGLSWQK
jgi:DNA-binding NarL/FixJ family response regulator